MPIRSIAVTLIAFCVVISPAIVLADPAGPDFATEVRPILSDHCFACHGPDEHQRQAGLRLDTADGITQVIAPGSVDESELIRRLHSEDADEIMPPPEYNKPLTAMQRRVLESWIEAGGEFRSHWAFEAPEKPEIPVSADHPIDYFVDAKIASKGLVPEGRASDAALLRRVCLDLTGLPPTREQIERVAAGKFDFEATVDELLASPSFGQHIGRYWLDLVRYADTHGLHLDNYREMWPYRDWVIDAVNRNMPFDQFITEQLAGDLIPDATKAQKIASGFNRLNVTTSEGGSIYDEVFARNVIDRTDAFGTIFMGLTTQCAVCHDHKFDPISQKDYYSLFAFFNSLDGRALDGNKKDHPPVIRVPSEEQLDQLAELDRQIDNLRQEMRGPITSVDQAQARWEQRLAGKSGAQVGDRDQLLSPTNATSDQSTTWVIDEDGTIRIDGKAAAKEIQTITAKLDPELGGGLWQTLQMEVIPDPETKRSGVSSNGNAVLTEIVIETRSSEQDGKWLSLPIRAAVADIEQPNGAFAISYAIDGKRVKDQGWAIAGHQTEGGRSATFAIPDLAQRIDDGHDEIRIRLEFMSMFAQHAFYATRFHISESATMISEKDLIDVGPIHVVGPFAVESENPGYYRKFASQESDFDLAEEFKYEGETYTWQPRPEWTPVAVHELAAAGDAVAVNVIHQSLTSPKKQTIELLLGTSDGHVVFLNKKRVAESKATGPIRPLSKTYRLELRKGNNDLLIKTVSLSQPAQISYAYRSQAIKLPESIAELASRGADVRSEAESASLRRFYRQTQCNHPDWLAMGDLIRGFEAAKEEVEKAMPTTLVWKELEQPREANLLIRGQYDQPGETVQRRVPNFLPPMQDDWPRDRMGLAKWLVSPEHPLTARVTVNRFWQILFGIGLVRSSEDFGSQGEPPTHPELLDWLAVEFRESGWDVKRIFKTIVTSDAYQREAKVDPANLAIDPANRYFARGPRHRLDAEVLRDQALALAGLLNEQAGGPSVKPPQPKGLWYAVGYTRSNTANFKADPEPEKRFRRSVYIFWKRTSAPPQMSTFDAPSRESCTARRERTNTPLQALLLMNEGQYLRAAKHLAARVLSQADVDESIDRIAWAFQTVTARSPSDAEARELDKLLGKLRAYYAGNPDQAAELLSVDQTQPTELDPAQHAAWMMIASTLLNLDEVVNK